MGVPFHDSLTGFVGVVLLESLSIAVDGDSFILPSVSHSTAVCAIGGILPLSSNPRYMAPLWACGGIIFLLALVEPFLQKLEDCYGQRQTRFPMSVLSSKFLSFLLPALQ